MKELLIRGLKLTAFGAAMIFLYNIFLSMLILTETSTEANIKNFYREPKNSIDVALIGASELFSDYSCPIAFDEYKFTSYNLAYSSAPGCLFNSMICEFLKYQNPQLVIIEINGYMVHEETAYGYQRRWLDNMDKSMNWFGTVCKNVSVNEQINYFLSIAKYHSNWENYTDLIERYNDMHRNSFGKVSMMKSFLTNTSISSGQVSSRYLTEFGKEQLVSTIEYCKKKNLKNVLFLRTPHLNDIEQSSRDSFMKIINENGYDYLDCDFLLNEIGLDPDKDFYNNEHLNVFGNEKFTKYLGQYIMNNYVIDTSHSQEIDNLWKECAEYTIDVFEKLKERTLKGENVFYFEYSDFSDQAYQKRIKENA